MKHLERIANVLNITNLLGTLPDIRLRRKLIINKRRESSDAKTLKLWQELLKKESSLTLK